MKKFMVVLLVALTLCSCLPAAYVSAENVNYALGKKYTLETSAGQMFLGGFEDSEDGTLLADGKCGGAEISGSTVAFVGTGAVITVTFDLEAIKGDIKEINFKNVNCSYMKDKDNGVADSDPALGNRDFNVDRFLLYAGMTSPAPKKDERVGKDKYEIVVTDHETGATDVTGIQSRDFSFKLSEPIAARYLIMSISSRRYVLSLDEIEIIGEGGPDVTAPVATETTAAPTEATTTAGAAVTTTKAAGTVTTNDVSKSDNTTAAVAQNTTKATTSATKAVPSKAEEEDKGSILPIILIVAGLAVVAVVVVIVLKKKK